MTAWLQRKTGRETVTAAHKAADAAQRGAEASTRSADAAQIGAEAATKSAQAAAHNAEVQERNLLNQRALQEQLIAFQRQQSERVRHIEKTDRRSEALTSILQALLKRPVFPIKYSPIDRLDHFGDELERWLQEINTAMPNAWRNASTLEMDVLVDFRHTLRGQCESVIEGLHVLKRRMSASSNGPINSIDQLDQHIDTKKALADLYKSFRYFDDDVTRVVRWIRGRLTGEPAP